MRRILIDRARRKQAQRHGGGRQRLDIAEVEIAAEAKGDQLLALDEALAKFAVAHPAKAELVKRASGSVSWINSEEAMSQFMDYESKVHCAIQASRMMAVCTYPARAAALHGSRELIHNHGKFFVKRGEGVHDNSRDAEKIEAVFASLAKL